MLSATKAQAKKYTALAQEFTDFNLRLTRAPLGDKPLVDWNKAFAKLLVADAHNSRRYARELQQHLTALKSGDKTKIQRSEQRLKRTRDMVKRRKSEYKKYRSSLSKYCHSTR